MKVNGSSCVCRLKRYITRTRLEIGPETGLIDLPCLSGSVQVERRSQSNDMQMQPTRETEECCVDSIQPSDA